MNYFDKETFEQALEGQDAMMKVTMLRQLADGATNAANETVSLAIEEAATLYPDYAMGGKKEGEVFEHNGHKYRIQVRRDFNCARINREYAAKEKELQRLKDESKVITKLLNALRKQTIQDHPNMRPTAIKQSFVVVE